MTDNRTLLTPSQVAEIFAVDPKTVTRWAKNGRLSCIRTMGGHRRFYADVVYALLEGGRVAVDDEAEEQRMAGFNKPREPRDEH